MTGRVACRDPRPLIDALRVFLATGQASIFKVKRFQSALHSEISRILGSRSKPARTVNVGKLFDLDRNYVPELRTFPDNFAATAA